MNLWLLSYPWNMLENREPFFTLFVEGAPHPQGSKTPVFRGGKIILIEGKGKGNQRWKDWRKTVSNAVLDKMKELGLEGETESLVGIKLDFLMPRPKSKPKTLRGVAVRPDIDKLARSVLDSIASSKDEERLISDDSRVIELQCSKYYEGEYKDGEYIRSPSGVYIEVYDLGDLKLWPKEPKTT